MLASELLQRWYDEVWDRANESYIDEGMDKDVVIHGLDPTGKTIGVDHFKTFYSNFRKSFPDVHVSLTMLTSNEEFATAHCLVEAKSSDGKDVHFTGLSVARFINGKLVEGWNSFDFLKMYQQLGHILVSQIQSS